MKRPIGCQDFVREARRLEHEQKIVVNFTVKAGRFRNHVRYDDELALPLISELLADHGGASLGGAGPRRRAHKAQPT